MKRFIKEYASYIKKDIANNDMIDNTIKDIAINRIDKLLNVHTAGLISIRETMDNITNAIDYAIKWRNAGF